MIHPGELTLQDVRCFQGEQRGTLRPITLLVGENSTGKTTFLGCYHVMHRLLPGSDFERMLDFNEEPFAMGSFRDIVRSERRPGGGIDEFKLGVSFDPAGRDSLSYRLLVSFSEEGSQPVVSSLYFYFEGGSYVGLRRSGFRNTIFEIPDQEVASELPLGFAWTMLETMFAAEKGMLRVVFEHIEGEGGPFTGLRPVYDYLDGVRQASSRGVRSRGKRSGRLPPFDVGSGRLPRMNPVAPLRSKPKRTYDPVRDSTSPDGEHVPMLMMRLDRTDKPHWTSLHNDLVRFGRESGLFSNIKVKRHGRQMSDPFQLQVKVRTGPHANIMDVGYGVSQSLPILVDLMHEEQSVFLLQQPEVHLHPRGQAALASLFIESSKKRGNRFLIETHSDYIVDRVRILVRKGELEASDVSVLYFEPKGNAVTIHNMKLDQDGNLEDAPEGYRDFFLKETDRLLGFDR